ncbi:hypothetical protein P154DRAFT_571479 [Amniculicola lignicola CBS 123094]|uniref:Uncharacterized protein n=1 Tax=Amniculicola lignicola CBS 123094 TaxID=1392246 RepID=A0A6A5WU96_9PLEO|nr:hypothetical protein P154DRAFT_571479 [Amniculicola lignicola CBS 123094]
MRLNIVYRIGFFIRSAIASDSSTYRRFGGLCPGEFLFRWTNFAPEGQTGFHSYPFSNGFANNMATAAKPIRRKLTPTPSMLIDRFGNPTVRFVSPAGAPYGSGMGSFTRTCWEIIKDDAKKDWKKFKKDWDSKPTTSQTQSTGSHGGGGPSTGSTYSSGNGNSAIAPSPITMQQVQAGYVQNGVPAPQVPYSAYSGTYNG